MIKHINKYFNPSGTVDSLSHIFDLIDIKQAQDESVIKLKAHFSHGFASLRMGGVAIDSALQVGFMLRALLSSYHGAVQDFRLGRHSLSTATIQTVVDHCVAYDKDRWKGPINKTGKPIRTPSANATGTSGNKANPYDAMELCSFGLHVSRWHIGCKENSKKCMVCHNMSHKPAHHTKDCPILRQLGFMVKRTPANYGDAASRVEESPAPTPTPAAPTPAPAVSVDGGLASMPGAFTAATEQKRIAMTPARCLIMRASMKDLCTTVNLSPTFMLTLMPPMPLLNLSTPPPSPRLTAAAPHHPSIPKASKLPHYPSTSLLSFEIPRPTPPHSSLAQLTVSSLLTPGQRTT